MANHKTLSLLLTLIISLDEASHVVALPSSPSLPQPRRGVKAAYWPSWQAESLPPSSIPTAYFTHVFYAFVLIDATTFQIMINQNDDQYMGAFTSTLHTATPKSIAILSIGGAGADPTTFSAMVSAPAGRAAFIQSAIRIPHHPWRHVEPRTSPQRMAIRFKPRSSRLGRATAASLGRCLLLTRPVVPRAPHLSGSRHPEVFGHPKPDVLRLPWGLGAKRDGCACSAV